MRIHCLQHVPWHGRAFLPLWAAAAGHDWEVTLVPEADRLPAPESFDALVIMGGPMSLREQAKHPWLVAEQRLLESVLERGQPFLGICLGAQLLAAVHGAPVRRGRHSEIGWYPLALTAEHRDTWLGDALPEGLETFFWHDDVFETPADAVRIAGTEASPDQAFVTGSALGLQFHLEVTPEWAAHLARRDAEQLVPNRYVQSATDILGRPASSYEQNNAVMATVLERWLGQSAVAGDPAQALAGSGGPLAAG
jgi:GMP synthase-like glutamine amidotransferase